MAAVSLYVHVPFCVSKCAYCDFTSEAVPAAPIVTDRGGVDAFEAYTNSVLAAVERGAPVLADVPTVYLGGGTPTVLGERLPGLLGGVLERVGLREGAEVTVETNPETTDAALIERLADAGATRFSLGVQSFDNEVLATLGRRHDARAAVRATEVLAGRDQPFSIDLICGVPGQSMAQWGETLERAAHTGALHVSVYALSVEPGTALAARIEAGELPAPDPDAAAEMLELAERSMGYHAMDRYEVANYAYPGYESRHNIGYWTGVPYLGVGPSAASMLPVALARTLEPASVWGPLLADAPDDGRVRFTLADSTESFVAGGRDRVPDEIEVLTAAEAAREDAMLGMRMTAGIPEGLAIRADVVPALRRLEADGLVERAGGRWRTTARGWLLGNRVFAELWQP